MSLATTHALALTAIALFLGLPAQALLSRAYLASDGNDTNPCTLAQPCRLLPAALAAVASGGEVVMLDSANYNTGQVNIEKSVSILAAPGATGSLVATGAGQAAIAVSANGLQVALRNISIGPIVGGAPGNYGINLTGASSVLFDGAEISNLDYNSNPTEPRVGIRVAGPGKLTVIDSSFRRTPIGITLQGGGQVSVSRSHFILNFTAVSVTGDVPLTQQISISDSTFSANSSHSYFGLRVYTRALGSVSRASVIRSKFESLTYALEVDSDRNSADPGIAEISFSGSMIIGTQSPFVKAGTGTAIYSLGDNHVFQSGGSLPTTPLAPQ